MKSKMMKFVKGMLIGLMTGMAIGAVGACCVKCNKKGFKRTVGKALRSVGDAVEHMSDMF